jgi:Ca2+-dependent lipid-binding protein
VIIVEAYGTFSLFSVGMDLDLAMEKLNINGKMYATFTLNMEAPFPHITHLNLTFVEKPEVWFSVRVLKVSCNVYF